MAQKASARAGVSIDETPFDINAGEELRFDVVEGGELVYKVTPEYRAHLGYSKDTDRTFIGFASVDDWQAIRSELNKRGHGVGAIHHLPVMD